MDISIKERRFIIENVLSTSECAELIYIQKSNSVIGYRDHFTVCTPKEIIARNPQHMTPFISAREKVQAHLEHCFHRELDVFIEFSSLTCWKEGSSIAIHYDSNRPYLRQREYSVTVYLNTGDGVDFEGGNFIFRDNERIGDNQNELVHPKPGLGVFYTSDESNMHGVEAISRGNRYTLMMWFTSDPESFEETSYLSLLLAQYELDSKVEYDLQQISQNEDNQSDLLMEYWKQELNKNNVQQNSIEPQEDIHYNYIINNNNQVIPYHFNNTRTIIKWLSFVQWQFRCDNINDIQNLDIAKTTNNWIQYEKNLQTVLQESIPKWKHMGLFFTCNDNK